MQVQLIDPKDKEESLDSEEEIPEVSCSFCEGQGMILAQDDMDDEEDRDFKQCSHCKGSGLEVDDNDEEEDYSFLDED